MTLVRTLPIAALLLGAPSPAVAATADCRFAVVRFPTTVGYDEDVQPIFERACVSCHQPSAPDFDAHRLDLRAVQAHAELIDRPTRLDARLKRVVPFEPGSSLLWEKVACTVPSAGERMPPPGHPALADEELRSLYGWIARGAPPGSSSELATVPVQAGLSGSWFDPSAPAQGFSFEVINRTDANPGAAPPSPTTFIAYWMTYALSPAQTGGAPTPVAPEARQRWMVLVGQYRAGDTALTLEAFRFTAGFFDDFFSAADGESIGSARLRFRSCDEAYLDYDLDFDGDPAKRVTSTIVLRRLASNLACATGR